MKTKSRAKGGPSITQKPARAAADDADRKAGKRKASVDDKSSKTKAKRAKKDPNKPKKPASAFFVFMEEFRTTFKKENPNVKSVAAVGKAAGERWASMTDEEKAPYEKKARKRKVEYEKLMDAYNNKDKEDEGSQESQQSKSEVSDEEDDATLKDLKGGREKDVVEEKEDEDEDEGEEESNEGDDEEEEEEEEEDDTDEDDD